MKKTFAQVAHLGACRPENNGGADLGHLFFAETADTHTPVAGSVAAKSTAAAKAICARCPIRAACLDDALATEVPHSRFGVLGGLSADERAVRAGDKKPAVCKRCGRELATSRKRFCDNRCMRAHRADQKTMAAIEELGATG